MQYATSKDIQDLLESLNTTNEIEVQAKILSLFSCYLVGGHSIHSDVIITSNFVYEKIYSMLSKGLPMKTTVTLNFVSALLFQSEDDACTMKQSLGLHVRNMLRISGCLALMSNLFNSCMVHQETWTALCRCLTEVCRHSQENQNYCSDLITTGIRRCATGDLESYQVLQSVLHKHDRNTHQFIECNGLDIFTRDKLHNTSCLRLVNEVAQNPKAVVLLVHETEVVEILRNFQNMYGKESTIGQWSSIILYHIKLIVNDTNKMQPEGTKTNLDYKFCLNNEITINNNYKNNHGDTTELFQNVFKEMIQSQNIDYGNNIDPRVSMNGIGRANAVKYINPITNIMKSNDSVPSANMRPSTSRIYNMNGPVITPSKQYFRTLKNTRCDLSFSFLLNANKHRTRNQHQLTTVSFNLSDKEKSLIATSTSVHIKQHIKINDEVTRQCYNMTKLDNTVEHSDENSTLEFKPTIVSTPKRSQSKLRQRRNYSMKYNKKDERSHNTFKPRKTPIIEVKNKSISGKLFGAINDSCTMLVKTVKSIFTTKNVNNNSRSVEKSSIKIDSCAKAHSNYSFMDYMRRRDAIMGSQCGDTSVSVAKSRSSCDTCNNTVLLKRKLDKDYKLKQTLKKLKLGINLYGCDFKKISATMWPRDSYMTPAVLYSLYRKLIAK